MGGGLCTASIIFELKYKSGPSRPPHAIQVSAAFRIEVLSEVPGMAQRAVARLAEKLDKEAKRGGTVEIGEEMRHLTLQVCMRFHGDFVGFFVSCPR